MLRILRNSLQQIVTNSQNWIENLEESAAALAFTKLGDKILDFYKTFSKASIQPRFNQLQVQRKMVYNISVRICSA